MDSSNNNNNNNNERDDGNRLESLMMAAIPRRARPPRPESSSSSLTGASAPPAARSSSAASSLDNMTTIPRRKPQERSGRSTPGGGGGGNIHGHQQQHQRSSGSHQQQQHHTSSRQNPPPHQQQQQQQQLLEEQQAKPLKPHKLKHVSIQSENPFVVRIGLKGVSMNNGGIPQRFTPTGIPKKRSVAIMEPAEEMDGEATQMKSHGTGGDNDSLADESAATVPKGQRVSGRTPKRTRPTYEEPDESDGLVDSSDEGDENYVSKPKGKKLRRGSQQVQVPSRSEFTVTGKAPSKATAADGPLGPLSMAGTEVYNFLDTSGAGDPMGFQSDGQVESPPPGMLSTLWYSRECMLHVWVVEKIVGWKSRPVTSLQWQDANSLKFLDPHEAHALSQKALTNVDFWNDPRKRMEVSRINVTQCPVVTTIAAEREKAKAAEEGVTPMYTLKVSPDQKEDVLLVKWRGRSYLHCSWERPTDIQKTDSANQTARHKIRRYYLSQEVLLGPDWKRLIEEERATAAAIHSHGDLVEGAQTDQQAGDEEFFPAQMLEIERIVGCDENEMDMNVLATQRALNIRAEQEELRRKEEADARDSADDHNSRSKPKAHPLVIQDLVDIHRKEEPWDPEGNVRYVVKWKGLPWADLTWEYWRDIKRDAVDEAEDFWHRQKPPSPLLIKEIVNKPHPHVRDFRKLQDSATYGITTRVRPVAKLGDGLDLPEEEESEAKQGFRLRSYQLEGVNWLLFNWWNKRSCILADEMGLGKTVQTLGFLQELWRNPLARVRGPFLIVAPLTLIGQWQSEARSWAPDFNVVLYHGSADAREFLVQQEFFYTDQFLSKADAAKLRKQHITKFNLLITTYEVVLKDVAVFSRIKWRVLIVDEAHRLKNPDSRLFAELASVPRDYCVLLTGTPLANNTEELWALLHFDDPIAFGDREDFMQKFGQLSDSKQVNELHTVLKPYLLRRVKEDVETSLPPKEEIILEVSLTPIQKKYYKAIYERNTAFLFKGAKPSNAPSLMNVMMELRKICNHPYLVKGVEDRILADAAATWKAKTSEGNDLPVDYVKLFGEQLVKSSGKMVLLEKLLLKLFTNGHKVLIFSQMVRVLDLLEELLKMSKYRYERLDGSTSSSSRASAVDRFNRKSCHRFVMLLSTRAGGLGLNLTSADTIVIFDSDWNPQNDLQAMARAHRIGQTRKVQIFRLLTAKTYEMHMFHSASMKLGLERAVLAQQREQNEENDDNVKKPKSEKEAHAKEIDELLKKGAYDIFRDDDDTEAEKFMETDIDQLLERSSKKVTYGAGSTATLASGLGSFSKASFIADTGDGEKDIDLDDPDFWAKAVGLDAPVETPEDVAQMLDDGVKRSRKQVQQFNPYAEFGEVEQRKKDKIALKEQEEKEEKERLQAEKKAKKEKKKKDGKEKKKLELKEGPQDRQSKSNSAAASAASAGASGSSLATAKEEERSKKAVVKDISGKKKKKNDKKRALRRSANEDPAIERLRQGWEAPQRTRVIAAVLRFGFGRFTKIRHESNLTSLPLQDIEVFLRSYVYQISIQVAVTLLERLQKSGNAEEQDFRVLIREWMGPGSDAEVEWLCSTLQRVVEHHMEVNSFRRFLRMPLILAEPSYVESLRHGAGFRALRRVGILSRLNRVVEIGLDTILSVLGHEELAKRGCGTSDLSTLDADLRARHVTTEELSLATGMLYEKSISLEAPACWWDRNCDIGLVIGSFIHGLGNYEAMRTDEDLPFAHNIRKYVQSDEACSAANSVFHAAAAAARRVFEVALDATKARAALEIQAAVAAAAAAAAEREKDAVALRQGGAAADAVLKHIPSVAAGKPAAAMLDGTSTHDDRYVTLPRLKQAMVDAMGKSEIDVVETELSRVVVEKGDEERNTLAKAMSTAEVVPDSIVTNVVTLPMPDSRVLDRRLLELLNVIEKNLDNTDEEYIIVEPGNYWETNETVQTNCQKRKKAMLYLHSSEEVVTNLLSEYSGIGINGFQCASSHRTLDDGTDYGIGAASAELSHIAYGPESPRYLRAIGVPMNLTRFALAALVYADASTLEEMLETERSRSVAKQLSSSDKADKKSETKSETKNIDGKSDIPTVTDKMMDEEPKNTHTGDSNNVPAAEEEALIEIRASSDPISDLASSRATKGNGSATSESCWRDAKLRATICSAVLLFGFPFQTTTKTIDISLWRTSREQSGAFDEDEPPSLFDLNAFMGHAKVLGEDVDLPDAESVRKYVEKMLLPFCVRLCVSGNGSSIGNARGSNGKYETALGVNRYPEPSQKVQSPLPDPFLPLEEHSLEAVANGLAILRRVSLMKTSLFIAGGGLPIERIIEAARSLPLCMNLDDLPLWWCPWVHDVALLVHAALNGLFSIVKDRHENDAGNAFCFQAITQSMYSTFVADEKALPPTIVERSVPDDVNDWINLHAEKFPSVNTLERRLAFLCTAATMDLDAETRFHTLPMFDHGGWPRL